MIMGGIGFIPNDPYINPVVGKPKVNQPYRNAAENSSKFGEILRENVDKLKFSAHAKERLRQRNISLSPEQIDRMVGAVDRAKEKGANESLLFVDDIAAVVSVKNKTVITVMDSASVKNNVFTNIDSAVIA